jgi:hypothetical protein
MLNKKIIIIIFLIIISLYIFPEYLVLPNGTVLIGKLYSINKKNIILEVNNQLYKFSNDLIDYLIYSSNQENEQFITIEKKNGIKEKIKLIKLTKNAIFYLNSKNNQISIILLKNIKSLNLENNQQINKKNNIKTFNFDNDNNINIDINNLIQLLNEKNKLNNVYTEIMLNFNELDFYEKFWKKINDYINTDTKDLLWNLYELYSNKEKYLNIHHNNGNNMDEKILNDDIIKIRKEFYYRAKKIIYNSEILINNDLNIID